MKHAIAFPKPAAKPALLAAGLSLSAVTVFALAAVGQNPPDKPMPPAAQAKEVPAPAKEKEKKFGFLNMRDATLDEATSIITGKAFKYTEDDMIVTGERGRYNRKLKQLKAEGHLVMDDPKHHVVGDKADVDNRKKIAIITDHVTIIVKPKDPEIAAPNPDASVQSERKQGVVITCDYVEDHYKQKFSILKGHLVFKQTLKKDGKMVERTMTAEHAEYDGATDKMLLFKPVKGHDSDGQTMEFEKDVRVGTKEGAETLESDGNFTGKFEITDDEGDSGADANAEKPKTPEKKP